MDFLLSHIVEICLLLCAILSLVFIFVKKKTVAKIITMIACCVNIANLFLQLISCSSATMPIYIVSLLAGLIAFSLLLIILAVKKKDKDLSKGMNILLYVSIIPMGLFLYVNNGVSGNWLHSILSLSYFGIWLIAFLLTASLKKDAIKALFKKHNAKTTNQDTKIDELKKLKTLLDAGIITQEEFDVKKKQILGL